MNEDEELERLRERRRTQLIEAASRPQTPTDPIEIESRRQFGEVLNAYPIVLVDCYADWCGPCKAMEPAIEALARESDAAVATVDVDRQRAIASEHRVRAVPTTLLFSDGQPVERLTGLQDLTTLSALVDRYLA
jgi:thioredoxin 1